MENLILLLVFIWSLCLVFGLAELYVVYVGRRHYRHEKQHDDVLLSTGIASLRSSCGYLLKKY